MKFGKEWSAGVVAGAIAGGVAGWIWTTLAGWVIATKAEDWWQIAGAIGTVGAVGFSVWTAGKVASRESAERRRRVQMAWTRIEPELVSARRNAEHAALAIRRMALHGDDHPVRETDISLLEIFISALSLGQCEAALPDLVHDESERGVIVAALVGEISRVKRRSTELCETAVTLPSGFEVHAFIVFEEVAEFGKRVSQALGIPSSRTFGEKFRNEFAQIVGLPAREGQP